MGDGSQSPGVDAASGRRSADERVVASIALSLLAVALVLVAEAADAIPPEHPVARAFVAAHNGARASIDARPGAPIPPLRWSPKLAGHAAQVAGRCEIRHSETASGENIVASGARLSPESAVELWMKERAHWKPDRKRCAWGRRCGHFTQIIWRDTREVGCAIRRCDSRSRLGPGPWYLAVCNYEPAGNVTGRPPY